MPFTRRHFLAGSVGMVSTGCTSVHESSAAVSFRHGVASGDPVSGGMVFWTRVTTDVPRLPVLLQIAFDPDFIHIVRTSSHFACCSRDHTVKADVSGLEPDRYYYYRFICAMTVSPVGRTRTLPTGADSVRLAAVSCSNYQRGYFNAYSDIAALDDIDAVIHLGDYIYENGADVDTTAFTQASGRYHSPAHECITLTDYRMRHAQYKADSVTQAMHAAHLMIALWDDHETADAAWKAGAGAHDPEMEGAWQARKVAALQAYYEWMPIRDPQPGRPREALFKRYTWPGFMTIVTLETRLTARSEPLSYSAMAALAESRGSVEDNILGLLADPDRRLMSDAQLDFVENAFAQSVQAGERWQLLGNQVMMAQAISPNLASYAPSVVLEASGWADYAHYTSYPLPYSLDAWGGYPAAREALIDRIRKAGVAGLLVLTGDTHQAWANSLVSGDGWQFGVEVGVTAVSSDHWLHFLGDRAEDYSRELVRSNPSIKYHRAGPRGYCLLELGRTEGHVKFVGLKTSEGNRYKLVEEENFRIERDYAGTLSLCVSA